MPEGQETYVTARVLGTFGYFDPEYTSVGIFAKQAPVSQFCFVILNKNNYSHTFLRNLMYKKYVLTILEGLVAI